MLILFEVFLRLFKPQIFEIHPQGMYAANPRAGYVLNPGFNGSIKREEFTQYFRVNDKSFRGKDYSPKNPGTYRILLLGDSYAFGFGVKENETFGAYLEQCLSHKTNNKVEVLNAGVPGYGTVDQLNFLKLCGEEIKPDMIIVQFLSVNDFEENRDPAVERSVITNGYLTGKSDNEKEKTSFSLSEIMYWLKSNLHSAKFVSERLGYLAMKTGLMGNMESFWGEDFTEDDKKIARDAFHEFVNYASHLNAEILLLYTVGQGQVISKEQGELPSERFISEVAAAEEIKWINTLREMRKRSDRNDLYYPIDGHWTPRGHFAVAEMICKTQFPSVLTAK